MTRFFSLALLGAALSTGLGPTNASAQQHAIFNECERSTVWSHDRDTLAHPWAVLHPLATYERAIAELARTGRWELAADEIITTYHLLAAHADLDPESRELLESHLDAMRDDLKEHGGDPRGLDIVGRFDSTVDPSSAEFTFGTAEIQLVVSADDSLATIRAICWTAIPADVLLNFANRSAQLRVLQGLDRAVAAWDAFNSTGYAQYPWELLLNRPRDGLMPPRWQVILMHPGLGLEVAGIDNLSTARSSQSVLLEPFGLLWYTDSRQFYLGASSLVSLPSGESPAMGGMLHLGSFAKIGYVFRAVDDGLPGRNGVVITADLLQLVSGTPTIYQLARDRAASLLSIASAE